jgi:hypothetical protein
MIRAGAGIAGRHRHRSRARPSGAWVGSANEFPGIAKGNWQWRLKDGALTEELAQRLRSITMKYGRLGVVNSPRFLVSEDDLTSQIAKRAYELLRAPPERPNRSNWLHAEREIKMEAKR